MLQWWFSGFFAMSGIVGSVVSAAVPFTEAADASLELDESVPPVAAEAPVQLALTFGDPVPLTQGEKASIRFLMPDVDPEAFPPETWGAVRGVLLSNDYDSEKRLQLKALLP